MKKFFAMLLALVMALSLVACGQQGGQQDSGDSDQPAGNDAPVAYVLAEKGDTYSLGLASNFQTAFEKLGGTVVMETVLSIFTFSFVTICMLLINLLEVFEVTIAVLVSFIT